MKQIYLKETFLFLCLMLLSYVAHSQQSCQPYTNEGLDINFYVDETLVQFNTDGTKDISFHFYFVNNELISIDNTPNIYHWDITYTGSGVYTNPVAIIPMPGNDNGDWSGYTATAVITGITSGSSNSIRAFLREKGKFCDIGAITLPVELTFFQAKYEMDEGVSLDWQTASETNNKGFEIEWTNNNESSAMREWETIGFVEGNGTTIEAQDYQFTHDQPTKGMNYYRLKQIDVDKNFEYSDIEVVNFKNIETPSVQIFPNPVKGDKMTIKSDASYDDNEIEIKVYGLTGKIWLKQKSFDAITHLNTSDLSAGIYLVEIIAKGQATHQKIVVE